MGRNFEKLLIMIMPTFVNLQGFIVKNLSWRK